MIKDLDYFKKKVIEILKQKEEAVPSEVKKSLDDMEAVYSMNCYQIMGSIEKSGYGVGTIRVWRGKKYKKVSANPTKWVRVYDKVDRGAKSSMTRLINKADACQSIDELLQFCMSNHAIFKDANGVDLPILDELRKAVEEKKTRLENGDTSSIRPEKKPASKKDNGQNAEKEKYKNLQNELKAEITDYDKRPTRELKEDVKEWKRLQTEPSFSEEHKNHMKEIVKISEAELQRREKLNNSLPIKEGQKLYYKDREFTFRGYSSGGKILAGDGMMLISWKDKEDLENDIKTGEITTSKNGEKNEPSPKNEEASSTNTEETSPDEYSYTDKNTGKTIKVERSDENGFQYTIYDKNGKELDGGYAYDDETDEEEINRFDNMTLEEAAKEFMPGSPDEPESTTYNIKDTDGREISNEQAKTNIKSIIEFMDDLAGSIKPEDPEDDSRRIAYKNSEKTINSYISQLKGDDKKEMESEFEKHKNRSEAMMGNQNAKKDGIPEEEKKESPKANDEAATKAELKKIEDLFEKHFNSYNTGISYYLRDRDKDTHSKAYTRAHGISLLPKAKEALEAEGYKMPEVPQMLLDKLAEYEKLNAEDTSYFKRAGDKTLSGIRQSVFDDLIEEFKKPLLEKYKALKNQLPKAKDVTKADNPILKGKTNEEQAQLITEGKYNDKSYIFYNDKPYAPITGWGNLGYQYKMVKEAGMEPENQINYVKNEVSKDDMWSVASTLKKYGEKKLKEIVKDAPMPDDEFNAKLLEKCTAEYKDYGYIYNQVYNHEYNKKVYETAKQMLDTMNASNEAINDIDLPVDPKDMDEAESIIGHKVFSIAKRSDAYGKSLYRAELKKMIEARIRNNPAVARAMLVYIKNYQKENNVVIFTPKNEIWAQLPKLNENAMNSAMNGEEETKGGTSGELYTGDGVSSVVEDKDLGRYQITFTGKPDADVRTLLKQNGFRWAPSMGVWQCYNTANGERSLAYVAEKLGWKKN